MQGQKASYSYSSTSPLGAILQIKLKIFWQSTAKRKLKDHAEANMHRSDKSAFNLCLIAIA